MKIKSFKASILDNRDFGSFVMMLKKKGCQDSITPFFKAVEDFTNVEVLHRRSERAKKLKLPKGDYYENMAMLRNNQGLRRLRIAKAAIEFTIKNYPPGMEKSITDPEMKQVLEEHEAMFKNELFEQDIPPLETEEIWTGYVEGKDILRSKGTMGLLKNIDSKIDKLAQARTDLMKGRKRSSPVYWKAMAIGAIAQINLFTLCLCFWTSDCSWALSLLEASVIGSANVIMYGC